MNANQPGSAETESNQNFDETKAKLNRQQSLKPENRSIETSSSPQRGTNPSNATTLDVANKNSKFFFTSKKLATNLMKKANSADASNGGFDTSWGKLDVNNWTLYEDGKHLNITGYTGSDHDHIIVPNGADFAKAGRNKNKLQTQISSDVTQTLKAKTVAFSKTDGQKTKLTNGYRAFADDDIEKFDGSNLDVSNVTDMDHMFYSSFDSNNTSQTQINSHSNQNSTKMVLVNSKLNISSQQPAAADSAENKLKTAALNSTIDEKLDAKMLSESKAISPANDTNGGFDEATWGKLNVNDWQGSVQGDYYQLTDYTGDANHIIVPNEADFAKAGISTSGKQVGVTSDFMHIIFRDKTTAQDATVAFSKTNNKQVKAIGSDWSNTWGHKFNSLWSKGKFTKFDGSNLDVSNVSNMSYMFEENHISDLTPLKDWQTSNVTDMSHMFQSNQISDLTPLKGWQTGHVTNMSSMFDENHISNLTPLKDWQTSGVTDMSGMFAENHISDLTPLKDWQTSNVTDMSYMFDNNTSIPTKTIQAKRVINFVYPAGYTGKKQDSVTQTVNVPNQKVKVDLTTKGSKPSNNILDWVTKTETPISTPIDPVYFRDYTVPKVDGLVPNVAIVAKAQADPNKPIIVTVTYTIAPVPAESVNPETPSDTDNAGSITNTGSADSSQIQGNGDTDKLLPALDIVLTHNAYIYQNDGITTLKENGKNIVLKLGKTIHAMNNGQIFTFNGKKFYQIGENEYVKVNNTLKRKVLIHNAFVYTKSGKAIKKGHKHIVLKKKNTILALDNDKIVTIQGKKFYRIGNNKYVKVANVKKD
ncbi:SLAP domain-containing protein [Lactobacillus kitasatonis]|uniref:Thermostable pullulanase n=1 Tax=Lactobacillus kitasatonis DSM 16761 = JCM 1039 TaxID=1423767 RepID=A0A0R1VPH3_9LACO|nr:BspA family leucine-rich repeat surface protein [Lactobacillus kitasatonis]KRM07343.1 thermostable pullulanase [Lactobacillus kitasatonis DSM 16761 = JCM 1039]